MTFQRRAKAFRRVLLVVAAACITAAAAAAAAGKAWTNQTYLLPITRWGPSNQKSDMRAVMALAKHLKCGVVLTGVRQHYLDTEHLMESGWLVKNSYGELRLPSAAKRSPPPKATEAAHDLRNAPPCFHDHYMPYERILDPAAVRKWVPAATVAELKAQGWDGRLDAVIGDASQRFVTESLRPENVMLPRNAAQIIASTRLNCEAGRIKELAAKVRKYRVVGVHKVFLGRHDWLTAPRLHTLPPSAAAPPPKDACGLALHKADRHMLRASAWVAGLADGFVARHLHGQPYLAIHVRPFKDDCLEAWRHIKVPPGGKPFPSSKAKPLKDCKWAGIDLLHVKLGRCAAAHMKRRNLTQAFVMTHPAIRHVVASLLGQGGLSQDSVVFMDSHQVTEQAGCHDASATFLSLVEEQVAVQATAFVGTSISTMTQVVALERMGRGQHDNAYWEAVQRTC